MNDALQEFLDKYPDEDIQLCNGCIELGYDDKPVILANWNHMTNEEFQELESAGYACEWSDEWITCDDCGKAFRCSPNSYSWEMCGIVLDGYALCWECMDVSDYLKSIENNPRRVLTCALKYKHNPAEYGYTLIQDDYESGSHPYQTDDPTKILAKLLQDDPSGRYIFVIDSQGQFDISYSVYKRIESAE